MKDFWKKANFKGHLLTSISYMIPIVCGGGFIIAIGMAFSGTAMDTLVFGQFSFWQALATLGGKALGMLPVIIATGIAFSIAGKPGIAPGFISGLGAIAISAGFIGGILGGYIGGWLAFAVLHYVKVPSWAKGLMPTLIVPFLASLGSGLIMVYIIGTPVAWFTEWLTGVLTSLSGTSNAVFGAIVGGLSIVDFGGPINKTMYAFSLTLQAQGINGPVTALQLTNTATPIGFGFAYFVAKLMRKNIFTHEERETLKSAVPMGVVNIVEGAIPIVMNDLVRGIVAAACGGVVEGALLMGLANGDGATVPFGGFLMLPTMGANWWVGLVAIAANILVTGTVYAIIKKNVPENEAPVAVNAADAEEELDLDDIQVM
ncbi:PTS fructose transporter subunit IIC [Bifidobacterium tsurumiense]|uniref:FrzABC PTS putative transporter, the PTS Fructose-Mannitol (Fru) Family n=1 Tax=Bifidobacterium tsurumiense TaxID=356829 RepID=A0A087E9K2_9BIFI|nr:PTS fructose transporter subunit IIC [Bifidobacterium tsurumiense]KFJ04453.1 FrzABC PTS putative transporter, the PTS Fructose-Mannitol (Fru) Family [Bifidobacterium tsurumiense]MDY4677496.1 PTS fructose transporter subunit IIC [Bifidobacterium tsurumiense]MSS13299.1 PTS fructose transporter subunit IIC [Bifidobacterium tsurumiense]